MSSAAARALKSASRDAFSWKPVIKTIPLLPDGAAAENAGGGREVWRGGSTRERAATLIPTHAGEGARLGCRQRWGTPSHGRSSARRFGGGPRVRTVEHLLSAMEALDATTSTIAALRSAAATRCVDVPAIES
ncbi:putative UDP-3-O-[3-hydroxymyristoyl] N-acetylglucosamine deacetylase 2 [Panicum miliaceum]|uniref:UDP-3-O-[3-hydroxymyristoyl] N-acetylglucosamine deacetylase 2 n=1 Tax=Panicum miliaceum TaxID=4540 RepID=A0A3L6SGX7_PANMI|nr:putative UDP-3-O-[3-hydroxymyristoyl] N-acetylglucosamine deacetylase 2 [Panicum miliaceum]